MHLIQNFDTLLNCLIGTTLFTIGTTSLMNAALGGHIEIAQLLVKNGADVNAKDDRGWLPKILITLK